MSTPSTHRGQWGSKLGFIMAAAGSAIGLGNIWRFPYTAGENGGGAFVLIYLLFVIVLGIPILLAELSIGRKTQRNPVGAFRALAPSTWWPAVGGLGVITGFGILSFYSVVAGWTIGYLYKAVTGAFNVDLSGEASNALFNELIGDPWIALLLTAIFLALTVLVVRGGISSGIERTTKVLMPLLFAILIVLAVRSLTLPGAEEGIAYLLKPDFSKMSVGVFIGALGQALFSLSLGMGTMITYGSYFPKTENMINAGVSVAFFDTMIAILAGLIIFPALFAAGVAPDSGPGLVFVVLPTIFGSLPAGNLFAIAFYGLLAIAALTSTISLLEVVVSYFVDERKWSRHTAAWVMGAACLVLAIPSALSQGATTFYTNFLGLGIDFLAIQSIVFGNYALSIGALFICLFVGWKWGIPRALASLQEGGFTLPADDWWGFLIKVVCPIAIIVILGYIIVTGQYF